MSFKSVSIVVKQELPSKVPPSVVTLDWKSATIDEIGSPPPPPPALMLFKLMPNLSDSMSYVVTPS